jgi:hypothetical protein
MAAACAASRARAAAPCFRITLPAG